MDSPIIQQEVSETIMKDKLNKMLSIDGFLLEFYKKFSTHLIPHFTDLLNYILEHGQQPNSWNQAKIIIIQKKRQRFI